MQAIKVQLRQRVPDCSKAILKPIFSATETSYIIGTLNVAYKVNIPHRQ